MGYGDHLRFAVSIIGGLVAALLLVGCSGNPDAAPKADAGSGTASTDSTSPSASAEPTPELGGKLDPTATPPSTAMDSLEKPIAGQLTKQIVGQGLSLDYLDCPKWDGKAPKVLTCKAYLDGVTADVRVRLTKTTTSVNFDAELQDGVLSTTNLVRQLKSDGYHKIDCGEIPAYPTKVGSEIVCAVGAGTKQEYVVATVLDRSGTVEINDN